MDDKEIPLKYRFSRFMATNVFYRSIGDKAFVLFFFSAIFFGILGWFIYNQIKFGFSSAYIFLIMIIVLSGIPLFGIILLLIYYNRKSVKIYSAFIRKDYNYLKQNVTDLFCFSDAIYKLVWFGTKKGNKILLDLLKKSDDFWIRIQIVFALAITESEEVLKELEELYNDDLNDREKFAYAYAIAYLGKDEIGIPILNEMYEDGILDSWHDDIYFTLLRELKIRDITQDTAVVSSDVNELRQTVDSEIKQIIMEHPGLQELENLSDKLDEKFVEIAEKLKKIEDIPQKTKHVTATDLTLNAIKEILISEKSSKLKLKDLGELLPKLYQVEEKWWKRNILSLIGLFLNFIVGVVVAVVEILKITGST